MTYLEARHMEHWPAAGSCLLHHVHSQEEINTNQISVLKVQSQPVYSPVVRYLSHRGTFLYQNAAKTLEKEHFQ
jgi:hypothetical protein